MPTPAPRSVSAPPLPGLYVHVPFCSAVCPYCDFAVRRAAAGDAERFVRLLAAEARLWAEEWRRRWPHEPFDTVYLGGGTPSILAPELLAELLDALRRHLPIAPEAHLSLEANPEDVTADSLAAWRELGVRTLSLGVQSFDRRALKFLGRRHSVDEAVRSVELAVAAGFDTVSVDLIFGLPEEHAGPDMGALGKSLARTVELSPQHVSCYQLTFHRGTPFGRGVERGVIRELPEPAQAAAYERVVETLAVAGYAPYEVSNFARPGHRSRHNRKYWRHVPYLGLGPSAHSFVPAGSSEEEWRAARRGRRWWNERSVAAWGEGVERGERPVAEEEALGRSEMAVETLMLGLRTAEGVDLAGFRERFGVGLVERNRGVVERLAGEGLVEVEGGWLRPTVRGLAVADGLPAVFAEIGPRPSDRDRGGRLESADCERSERPC